MIDVVFWDFGGVFTPSPFGGRMTAYAESKGLTLEALIDLILGYHTPDGDHPWHRVERGELTIADAMAELYGEAERRGIDGFSASEFFGAMAPTMNGDTTGTESGDPKARPAVVDLLGELHDGGTRHSLITNNVKEFADSWRPMVPLDRIDDIVDSSEVGMRKPNPAIYELALSRMGDPDPQRTVFLDDFAGNLPPAADLGMRTILVGDDPAEALAELRDLAGR